MAQSYDFCTASIPIEKIGSLFLLNREEDASPAAAAFSSVSGVLGGFSMTLEILALSPQVISSDIGKDWIVAIILLSAGLYLCIRYLC